MKSSYSQTATVSFENEFFQEWILYMGIFNTIRSLNIFIKSCDLLSAVAADC